MIINLFWLLSSLCFLDTTPLSDIWFTNIFYDSMELSCFCNGTVHNSRDFNFDEVQFMFLTTYILCKISKKLLPATGHNEFLLCLPVKFWQYSVDSETYTLVFVHFVHGTRVWANFMFFLHVNTHLSQHPLLKGDTFFSAPLQWVSFLMLFSYKWGDHIISSWERLVLANNTFSGINNRDISSEVRRLHTTSYFSSQTSLFCGSKKEHSLPNKPRKEK